KEENAYSNLPENIHTTIENLNPEIRELIVYNRNNNSQESLINYVQEEEIINLNEENIVEIYDSNEDQDLILFKKCKYEIFELFDSAKRIFEENEKT
ncbi:25985_t:CDS:1, partial [Dentiscutata erythropus]